MSNQDYIDYENSIAAQNTAATAQLTLSNIDLNQNITQNQSQIANNLVHITQVQTYNTYITAIIGFLTDLDMIAYQDSIATKNTDLIAQLMQSNINLNQNITRLQTIITNNIAQIDVLQVANTYIIETIALIPVSSSKKL